MQRSNGSTPSFSWMTDPLTQSLRERPATLWRILVLGAWIHDLVLSERRLTGKSGSSPFTLALSLPQRSGTQTAPPPVELHLSLTHKQDAEIPELLHSRQDLSTNSERAKSTLFRWRTMALDMEVLILISATSHSAANWPCTCWRSWLDETNGPTSRRARSRDEILWFPNWTPFLATPKKSVHKILNRTADEGHPCQSPTCTGKRSDLLLAL